MLHWLPINISTYGHKIDHVILVIYLIVGIWFLLAEGILGYFIIRYHRSKGQPAIFQPGTSLRSLMWVLIPAALVLAFDIGIEVVQGPIWEEIKMNLPEKPDQTIRIRGRQFVWEITHPGPDGRLDTADDIKTFNQLTIPVHQKIVFELQAEDVIHSLWIPNLRLKQDAVPGRTIRGWFETMQTGTYPIACAELCGSGHGTMQGQLHVMDFADYQKWLAEQTPSGEGATSGTP